MFALPSSNTKAVLMKVAMKIVSTTRAVCAEYEWYPTFEIKKIFIDLMIMLTSVTEPDTQYEITEPPRNERVKSWHKVFVASWIFSWTSTYEAIVAFFEVNSQKHW